MITAKEARERTEAFESENIKSEKEAVEEKINLAVDDGLDFCFTDFNISEATIEWLSSLDYKAKNYNCQRKDKFAKIKW